jgi:hypothetical protein
LVAIMQEDGSGVGSAKTGGPGNESGRIVRIYQYYTPPYEVAP